MQGQYLIEGSPGTGKTTLSLQFLLEGLGLSTVLGAPSIHGRGVRCECGESFFSAASTALCNSVKRGVISSVINT